MRTAGVFLIGGGVSGGLVCLLLKQTAWYAGELSYRMSEPVEFITSAFWACVLLALAGLLLLLRSLRRPKPAPQSVQEPEYWSCACCGEDNPIDTEVCLACGMPYGSVPDTRVQPPADDSNWVCPWCGRVWSDASSVCTACGYSRYGDYEEE